MPVAQRVGPIPTNADQDHIDRKAQSPEVEHIDSFWGSGAAAYLIGPSTFANTTDPVVFILSDADVAEHRPGAVDSVECKSFTPAWT